jgi:hypothetical protein
LLRDSLKCTREGTKTIGEDVFDIIKCCHGDPPSAAVGRRLLTSDDLLNGAAQNPGATEGLTFEVEESSAKVVGVSGLMVTLALLC